MQKYKKLARNPYRKTLVMKKSMGGKRRTAMKLFRQPRNKIAPGENVYIAKIDVSLPLYIYASTGPSFAYSFSTNQISLNAQILNTATITGDIELRRLSNIYMYSKVNGVSVRFNRTLNAAINTIYQLPALSVDICGELTSLQSLNITKDTVENSDSALRVQVLNSIDAPISKYWGFKECFTNSASTNAFLGCWNNTFHQPIINLIIGYSETPSASNVNDSPRIGTLDCQIYMSFCKNLNLNNV